MHAGRFTMGGQRRDEGAWWLAEAALLGLSAMSFLTLLSFGAARLLQGIGLTPDYNYLERDDAQAGTYSLACGVVMPLILVLLSRLWRRRG